MVDASGNLVTQYAYDPFGNTTTSRRAPTQMPSNTRDVRTKATDCIFIERGIIRPCLGRFVNEDPLAKAENFYADNDPIQFSDLLGLWSWLEPFVDRNPSVAAFEVLKSLSAAGNPKAQYELTNWNRRQHFLVPMRISSVTARHI